MNSSGSGRLIMLLALLGLAAMCDSTLAAALPEAKVALVDSARIETDTATLQRIRDEAAAQTPPLKPAELAQGVELALSEILTVLPEAVATIARQQKIDLVVQASAWPESTGERPADLTVEVIAEIDRRLTTLKFTAP